MITTTELVYHIINEMDGLLNGHLAPTTANFTPIAKWKQVYFGPSEDDVEVNAFLLSYLEVIQICKRELEQLENCQEQQALEMKQREVCSQLCIVSLRCRRFRLCRFIWIAHSFRSDGEIQTKEAKERKPA
jgi:hypothetical protein